MARRELPPLDLAPLLAQADAETWLKAIQRWRRERRERMKAIAAVCGGFITLAGLACLLSVAKRDGVEAAGRAFADVLEAAVRPPNAPSLTITLRRGSTIIPASSASAPTRATPAPITAISASVAIRSAKPSMSLRANAG